MSVTDASPPSDRLIAPREDGVIVSRPALSTGVSLVGKNASLLESAPVQIGGRSLQEFRQWTRSEVVEAGRSWMVRHLGIEFPAARTERLIITGHQPQLNHPGVWMKNVATSRLAECCGGTGLNLIVDNDLAVPPTLRCPVETAATPGLIDLPYDRLTPAQPWEERQIQNSELFASFPQRVAETMRPWGIEPILPAVWPAAMERQVQGEGLATALTACRVAQERRWHVRNLELPVSELCQTEPFLAFVAHLCRNAEKFFAAYNQGVADYRRKYRIRNARHPVPDLVRQGELLELPFWYWEPGDHDRSRLFVRSCETDIELWGKNRLLTVIPVNGDELAPLKELQRHSRLRTRALTTTLFARLCLGDLFLHGIGGARYDEITDGLFRSFFGIASPAFLTLTATLHLPLSPSGGQSADPLALKAQIRQLEYSGDEDSPSDDAIRLRRERDELLQRVQAEREAGSTRRERRSRRADRRRRHLELVRIRGELVQQAQSVLEQRQCELELARQQALANTILQSREFSSVLFPERKLLQLVQDVQRLVCGR